jgi:hypothetical protein
VLSAKGYQKVLEIMGADQAFLLWRVLLRVLRARISPSRTRCSYQVRILPRCLPWWEQGAQVALEKASPKKGASQKKGAKKAKKSAKAASLKKGAKSRVAGRRRSQLKSGATRRPR